MLPEYCRPCYRVPVDPKTTAVPEQKKEVSYCLAKLVICPEQYCPPDAKGPGFLPFAFLALRPIQRLTNSAERCSIALRPQPRAECPESVERTRIQPSSYLSRLAHCRRVNISPWAIGRPAHRFKRSRQPRNRGVLEKIAQRH